MVFKPLIPPDLIPIEIDSPLPTFCKISEDTDTVSKIISTCSSAEWYPFPISVFFWITLGNYFIKRKRIGRNVFIFECKIFANCSEMLPWLEAVIDHLVGRRGQPWGTQMHAMNLSD